MLNLAHAALLAQSDRQSGGGGAFGLIIELVLIALFVVGMWKTFVKAGKPGWASLIPIYNLVVLLEIAGRPLWWIILYIIPIVNIIIAIVVGVDVAKNFGKGTGFGVGLAILGFIFYPILGFSDAVYRPVPK